MKRSTNEPTHIEGTKREECTLQMPRIKPSDEVAVVVAFSHIISAIDGRVYNRETSLRRSHGGGEWPEGGGHD